MSPKNPSKAVSKQSTEHLKPHQFKPGKSGNPNGRPKKLPRLDDILADILGEETQKGTAIEGILRRLNSLARNGNIRAAELLIDRAYGKATQKTEISGKDGAPIEIKWPDGSNPTT